MCLGQLRARGQQSTLENAVLRASRWHPVMACGIRGPDPRGGRSGPRAGVSWMGPARSTGRSGSIRAHDSIPGPWRSTNGDSRLWSSRTPSRPAGDRARNRGRGNRGCCRKSAGTRPDVATLAARGMRFIGSHVVKAVQDDKEVRGLLVVPAQTSLRRVAGSRAPTTVAMACAILRPPGPDGSIGFA